MKKKIIRSCELKHGGACDFIYLIKESHEDGRQVYIVDDHYTYTTRDGEVISDYSTSSKFCDHDLAVETYNGMIKLWL